MVVFDIILCCIQRYIHTEVIMSGIARHVSSVCSSKSLFPSLRGLVCIVSVPMPYFGSVILSMKHIDWHYVST